MLDIAWPELMVIGAVALVAIGPKDLPKVMHTLGRWAGKARRTVGDIQRAFDQLNYESELDEKFTPETPPPAPPETSSKTSETSPPTETGHD